MPQSYLQAWCDPDRPSGYTPYINLISQNGAEHSWRAPENVFNEIDFYTIKGPNGERDLQLEHGLNGLETSFARIRKELIELRRPLATVPRLKLLAFTAAMHARTKSMRDHHRKFWTGLLRKMERIEQHPPRYAAVSPSSPSGERGMDIHDVRSIAEQTMAMMFKPIFETELEGYARMRASILCADDEVGFITSDAPVVWFDPEAYKYSPLYRSPGLARTTLEVTFPLSPQRLLLLMHGPPSLAYMDVHSEIVHELNRRTCLHSHESIVVRKAYLERG